MCMCVCAWVWLCVVVCECVCVCAIVKFLSAIYIHVHVVETTFPCRHTCNSYIHDTYFFRKVERKFLPVLKASS